ncbi:MAG TPA: four-carbon acid sugar kinase family protein [Sedimentibacter sp.]|nr:four-carbon acid sugar kinase family protein [Sedimentibacter sp.]HNZ82774.1 four-carbon acid sugar kinase family protein [Sedimentibacter sp.]HOH69545.1 four-carbon acid sugar kinase family protein [Sedimentibacter sp.]HPW99254.1 four-carbon acid sugar kinase family protein [Sedimentibacter sp.]HQB63123.1 four-carbon acid sugar kinase family protein [Sedimentibacter sp.]
MSKVIIIADDLTGANATGVLLARQGFKSATFLNLDKYDKEESKYLDVISISTDSRAIHSDEAYERVKTIAEFFKDDDVALFSKRIDSTLRGNIGSEISGLLDNLQEDTYALVVPAFPSSGRVCIGGFLMVNQVPLEKTDVAKDPKTPVYTSRVVSLLEEQTDKNVGFVELDKVLKGEFAIEQSLLSEIKRGCRIIVVDATTDEDIDRIAKAVKNSKLNIISVDPGPFTAAVAREYLEVPAISPGKKVMLTIGSVSNLTRKQIDELRLEFTPYLVEADALKLIYEDTKEHEMERIINKLMDNMEDFEVIGVITTRNENQVLNLTEIANDLNIHEEEVSLKITNGLAEITTNLLKKAEDQIGGLYTSGGDVTVAVCKALECAGIEVKDEVLPLAVYGRLIKGKYHNTPIITKGGLVGDEKALIKCVNYLLTKLSNEYGAKNSKKEGE